VVDLPREEYSSPLETGAALLSRVADFLVREGVESYVVGGYLRDVLLGKIVRDIDIAVKGNAPHIARQVAITLGGAWVLLDEVNQIARVVLKGENAAPWHLDFVPLRGDVREDLARRDFTINAMAVSLGEWNRRESLVSSLIDPYGGLLDLEKKRLRTVSPRAFQEDPARLLRAVRLSAEYGFTIEEETETLIQSQSQLLAAVAAERVREELCRLLSCPEAARFLRYLDRLGLLQVLLPELTSTRGVEQPREHFWDVFDHSIESVATVEFLLREGNGRYGAEVLRSVPWSPELARYFAEEIAEGVSRKVLLKLAALLHDIAKPQCRSVAEGGRIRFLGHAREGASLVEQILERLRFSNREVKMVKKMVEQHLRPGQMSNNAELPTRRAIYRYFRDTAEVGIDILFLGLADHLATRGPNLDLESWREHGRLVEHVLLEKQRQESTSPPPKLIDGHDLIRLFRLSPGPLIGKLLEMVKEAQAAGEISSREEALALVRQQLESRQG
jgi:poly(A) polymerase